MVLSLLPGQPLSAASCQRVSYLVLRDMCGGTVLCMLSALAFPLGSAVLAGVPWLALSYACINSGIAALRRVI